MKYKDLVLIQLGLSILCFITSCIAIIHDDSYAYLSMGSLVLIGASVIMQTVKFNQKNIFKYVLLALWLFGVGVLSLTYEPTEQGYTFNELISAWCSLFALVFLLTSLVQLFIKETQFILEREKQQYLPRGYYSRNNLIINTTISIVFTLVAVYLVLELKNILVYVIAIVALLLVFAVQILIQGYTLKKPFRLFEQNMDFEEFETNLNKYTLNENIHPETRNFLNIIALRYVRLVSLSKNTEYNQKIKEPSVRSYQYFYDLLKLNYSLSYDDVKSEYEVLKTKYHGLKTRAFDRFMLRWEPYYLGTTYKDLDKLCPLNTKNNITNAENMFIQIHYYYKNNDIDKAFALKDEFLKKFSGLKLLIKQLENIQKNMEN